MNLKELLVVDIALNYAVIKLNHLFKSIDHIGLTFYMINQNAFLASLNFRGPTQKIDASFRLWLNCGTVNITVAGAGSGGTNMACSISPQQNTFSFSNTKKNVSCFCYK